MLIHVPEILATAELKQLRDLLADAPWADGRITAGTQSAEVKRNLQLPEDCDAARAGGLLVRAAVERSALFFTAALPRRIFPPLFNRYEGGMTFGSHIDNAVRRIAANGERVRTDLSATLFLSDPDSYDGGELVIEDTYGERHVKLAAGDLVLYPGTSVHRVEPVTRGTRLASFFWIQSMVRSDEQRRLLFDLDMATLQVRESQGESPAAIALAGCYHNLLRMWAEL